jgi:hypothetical protein
VEVEGQGVKIVHFAFKSKKNKDQRLEGKKENKE